MSGGPISVDRIIKGVSPLDELLRRPPNDDSLDSHLIVPEASQVDPDWVGEDFVDVGKHLNATYNC